MSALAEPIIVNRAQRDALYKELAADIDAAAPERYITHWSHDLHDATDWMNVQAAAGFRVVSFTEAQFGDAFGVLILMEDKNASVKARGLYVEPADARPVTW